MEVLFFAICFSFFMRSAHSLGFGKSLGNNTSVVGAVDAENAAPSAFVDVELDWLVRVLVVGVLAEVSVNAVQQVLDEVLGVAEVGGTVDALRAAPVLVLAAPVGLDVLDDVDAARLDVGPQREEAIDLLEHRVAGVVEFSDVA